jgi:hypothetical protein
MPQINDTLNKLDYIFIFILFIFSFAINWNFAKYGVFPIDSFYHYDPGYRITNGEFPVKDYWVTTGIFVDFIEAFFFFLLGANWFAHVLHSSILNGLITVLVYFTFIKFNLKKNFSFIFSFFFGVLAYTSSATPFVDHHAAFFLLAGTLCFAIGIKTNFFLYWLLAPWLFGLSFLCKQVPSSYLVFLTLIVLSIYFLKEKNKYFFYLTFGSSILFLSFICSVIYFLDIGLKDFFIQYLLYPPSIGEGRFEGFKITFSSFFNHYKFILIPFFLIIFLNFKNKKKNQYSLFLILSLVICLVFHQILTKNQIYINFLSPLLFGFLMIEIQDKNYRFKNSMIIFIVCLSLFVTLKYHERFNENRKFHELFSVDMKKSIDSSLIHKKLSGFKWITSEYEKNVASEVALLNLYQKKILEDNRNKMVITHYLFLDSLMKENLNAPSRSFTLDGASFPIKDNKYYLNYKNFFINKIKKEKIEVIYIMDKTISENVVLDYIERKCIKKQENTKIIKMFELEKNCSN